MKIKVRAKPNSRKNEVIRLEENFYEVKVTSPPEKGKANEKIRELLAKYLNIPKSKISLVNGETYKEKIFEVKGS
jgi:uncharacterized protein (TIGR00251 family)